MRKGRTRPETDALSPLPDTKSNDAGYTFRARSGEECKSIFLFAFNFNLAAHPFRRQRPNRIVPKQFRGWDNKSLSRTPVNCLSALMRLVLAAHSSTSKSC